MAEGSSQPENRPVRSACVFLQVKDLGLGDMIMRRPLFALLEKAFPRARLAVVVTAETATKFADFFARHSPFDEVVRCPPVDAGTPDEAPDAWRPFLEDLRARRFDACLVDAGTWWLHADTAEACGIPRRYGVRLGRPQEARLTDAGELTNPIGVEADLVDYLQAYAAALGVRPPRPREVVTPFPFQPEDVELRRELRHPALALHAGGQVVWNRRWPPERFAAVGARLLRAAGGSVVLFGSDESRENAAIRSAILRERPQARVLDAGSLSLNQMANVLAACDLFLGNDSSPMHVAAALGVPTVVLYGPTDGGQFWRRVYTRHHMISRGWACQRIRHPWQTQPRAACRHRCAYRLDPERPSYPQCLLDIEVDEVWEVVSSLLALRPEAATAPRRRIRSSGAA